LTMTLSVTRALPAHGFPPCGSVQVSPPDILQCLHRRSLLGTVGSSDGVFFHHFLCVFNLSLLKLNMPSLNMSSLNMPSLITSKYILSPLFCYAHVNLCMVC
jgi:hypothetical protein